MDGYIVNQPLGAKSRIPHSTDVTTIMPSTNPDLNALSPSQMFNPSDPLLFPPLLVQDSLLFPLCLSGIPLSLLCFCETLYSSQSVSLGFSLSPSVRFFVFSDSSSVGFLVTLPFYSCFLLLVNICVSFYKIPFKAMHQCILI